MKRKKFFENHIFENLFLLLKRLQENLILIFFFLSSFTLFTVFEKEFQFLLISKIFIFISKINIRNKIREKNESMTSIFVSYFSMSISLFKKKINQSQKITPSPHFRRCIITLYGFLKSIFEFFQDQCNDYFWSSNTLPVMHLGCSKNSKNKT